MCFTSEIHKTTINFLDLTINLGGDGSVVTKLYRKPISNNGFLHFESFHPTPLKRGMPTGQYLRARHNCSDEISFKSECDELYNRFRARGYSKKVLHRAYARARTTSREDLLVSKKKASQSELIIDTFDYNNKKVMSIFRKY